MHSDAGRRLQKTILKNAQGFNLLCYFWHTPISMALTRHIPNFITLLNLFCGCAAIVAAAGKDFQSAFLLVCLGIFFDFFDGFFARMFNVAGPLGVQLDSLADMVTSGVTPGFVLYLMMGEQVNLPFPGFPYLGFIVTLGSCMRLAKFNIDTRQTDSFIGLPTPANALFILSLPLVLEATDSLILLEALLNPYLLLLIAILSAWVMNAEIPLFSLKVKSFDFRKYGLQFGFLAASLVLITFLGYGGVTLTILFYILLSIVSNMRKPTHA